MTKQALIGLGGIAEAEINSVLAGIRGTGRAPWTANLRPVVRKDDPPEDDETE